MIRKHNDCVGCADCIGCGLNKIYYVNYCDRCEDNVAEYEFDEGDLCEECWTEFGELENKKLEEEKEWQSLNLKTWISAGKI
jgi:hypothetical protein